VEQQFTILLLQREANPAGEDESDGWCDHNGGLLEPEDGFQPHLELNTDQVSVSPRPTARHRTRARSGLQSPSTK
jgi:hypothetical protein